MSKLGQVVESIEKYNKFVLDQVKRARTDEKFGRELLGRWNDIKAKIPVSRTPTGLPLPRLALPEIDEPGEIARYLLVKDCRVNFHFSTAPIARCIWNRFARSKASKKTANLRNDQRGRHCPKPKSRRVCSPA